MTSVRIALVGDRSDEVVAHRAIPVALDLVAASLGRTLHHDWIESDAVGNPGVTLADYDGVWGIPGSPYRDLDAVLAAIRLVREHDIPYLGTCAGFQHAVIEFARNVAAITGADHMESNPGGDTLVMTALTCALRDVADEITLVPGSRLARAYGSGRATEEYMCGFGLNPAFRTKLEDAGMRFTAFDHDGAPRAAELPDRRFFVATLFQPERAALRGIAPALVRAFVAASVSLQAPM